MILSIYRLIICIISVTIPIISCGQDYDELWLKSDSLLNAGNKCCEIQNYEESIKLYSQAYEIADSLNFEDLREDISFQIASAYNEMSSDVNNKEAIELYTIALDYIGSADLSNPDVVLTRDLLEFNLICAKANDAADSAYVSGDFTEAIELTDSALSLYGDIYGVSNEQYGQGLSIIANYLSENSDYEKAIEYEKKAAETALYVSGENSTDYAASIRNIAVYYLSIGKFDETIEYAKRAAALYSDILGNQSMEYASALGILSNCYKNLGCYDTALEYGEKAVGILVNGNDEWSINEYVYSLMDMYACYLSQDNYIDALKFVTEAADAQKYGFGKGNRTYIEALFGIAKCNKGLGQFDAAREVLDEAVNLSAEVLGTSSFEYLESLYNLALLQDLIKDVDGLVETIKKVIDLVELIDLSEVTYSERGYALNVFSDIISMYLLPLNYGYGLSIPGSEYYLDQLKEIIKLMLSAFNPEESPNAYCRQLDNLAYLHEICYEQDSAIVLLEDELEVMAKIWGNQISDYAYTMNRIGVNYASIGDIDEAIRKVEEAQTISDSSVGRMNNQSILCRRNLALYHAELKHISELNFLATEITGLSTELIRSTFAAMTSFERAYFWEIYQEWFGQEAHQYAFTFKTDSLIANGYNAVLLSKGLLLNSEIEFSRLIQESEDKEAVSMYEEWVGLRRRIDYLRENAGIDFKAEADSLEMVAQSKERDLIRTSEIFGDYTRNLTLTWEQVRESLSESEAAVEFVSFPTGTDSIMYVAYVIRYDSDCPEMIPLFEEKELFIKDRYDWYATSYITGLVWQPLENMLQGVHTVYFSPSGELYNIAVENLPAIDGNGHILDFRRYCRVSSTREVVVRGGSAKMNKAVLYGGLQYDLGDRAVENVPGLYSFKKTRREEFVIDSLDRSIGFDRLPEYLPATKTEVEKINKYLEAASVSSKIYSGQIGTEASFKNLSGRQIHLLHLATHGFYWTGKEDIHDNPAALQLRNDFSHKLSEDKAMGRSGLLFAGASLALSGKNLPENVEDGVLTAKEIATMDLRNLDMVVLSACQSGLGQVAGDGVFGLQRGFKKAGANTLLMTLWNVDDKATQMLMERFYANLLSGMDKYDALFEAQRCVREYEVVDTYLKDDRDFVEKRRDKEADLEYIPEEVEYKFKPYESPRYWAAFVLMDGVE